MKRLVRLFRRLRIGWLKSRLRILKFDDFELPCEDFKVNSDPFGKECTHHGKVWGKHLGVDFNTRQGTIVHPIADGKVVYTEFHPGTKEHPNWGNVVIVVHKLTSSSIIYSLYAHLELTLVMKGMAVKKEDPIGIVAEKMCPENGWWEESHIHLGIFLDPEKKYLGGVLPGYDPPGNIKEWADPVEFIESHKKLELRETKIRRNSQQKTSQGKTKKKGKKKHKRRR